MEANASRVSVDKGHGTPLAQVVQLRHVPRSLADDAAHGGQPSWFVVGLSSCAMAAFTPRTITRHAVHWYDEALYWWHWWLVEEVML